MRSWVKSRDGELRSCYRMVKKDADLGKILNKDADLVSDSVCDACYRGHARRHPHWMEVSASSAGVYVQ